MKLAVTIGAYKLPEFVRLNLAQCRAIFGDETPLLVSDDRSPSSDLIREAAEEYGASYLVGDKRRSHFSGDMQAFINAAKFAEQSGADLCLKLSQRFVPSGASFRSVIEAPFVDPEIWMVLPGQMQKHQVARPQASFYAGFGLLTDCVAWRPERLTGEDINRLYKEHLSDTRDHRKGKHLVEPTIGWIIANHLNGKAKMLGCLANHEIGRQKLYLRKAQSNRGEYIKLAETHGITGEFDVREWGAIEARSYVAIGPVI